MANLRHLVVKPIARDAGSYQVLGWKKSASELDDLRRQIDARPHWWAGQQQLGLASTPTLTDRGLEGRRCVVRTFAVRRGDSYLAMPGGLARVSVDDSPVADTVALALAGPDGDRPELDDLLARIIDGLHVTADAIAETHFTHLLPQRGILTPADPEAARSVHELLP